jgi:8-oxo-dGTP pyrophosphatase MutT (NUDIX family)
VKDTDAAGVAVPALLPVEEYVAGLPRKRMAAGALFYDEIGRVLLVEPSYKPNWEVPGGAVEEDESPWQAAAREVAEELRWDKPIGRLLVVDHVRPQDSRPEGVIFMFDGGLIEQKELAEVSFADGEVLSVGLCHADEVRARCKPLLADRLAAAMEAVKLDTTVLCEQGRRVS